jgi:hypothetical protein
MSGYIGTQPVPQATQTRDAFTATNNQTSFPTSGYTPEFLDVFLNGVKLAAADYTATNGSDVVLAAGATTGDILEVVSYGTFEVLNPTFDGNVTFTGNASFGDNDKAIFGAELEIYSDATHARIREYGSGQLKIQGDNMQLLTSNGASTYIEGNASTSAVTLYHASNSPRLATTSTGIDVTGTVTSTGLIANVPTNTGLTINSTDVSAVQFNVANGSQKNWGFASTLTAAGDFGLYQSNSNGGNPVTAGTARLYVDVSGNLLVGKTTSAFATAGTKIAPAGQVEITAASDGSLALGRTGSYGYIQRFYKDSLIAGYIGSYSGSGGNQFYISGADTGFKFNSVVDVIAPSNANGATRDNAISLGDTGGRWKDLYLAGGVYLGGTGSANKLEDYEEGTWNPVVTGSSTAGTMNITDRLGKYTKVGRLVTLHFYFDGDSGNGSGNLLLGGVPFTIANHHFAFGSPQWNTGISYPSGGVDANWLRYNSTSFDIRCNRNNSNFVTVPYSSNVEYLRGCITYETDA